MTKVSKIIALLAALLICVSACVLTVYADDPSEAVDPGQGGEYSDPGYVDPGQGGGEYSDPGYVDPGQGGGEYSDPGYVDPGQGGGEYSDPGYVEPYDPGYSDGGNSQQSYVYYDSDGNTYSDQSEVYVGGGQVYEPPISTAPSVALFDTKEKADVSELSKNDWNDIAAKLKNADNSGAADVDDFGFIQQNTSKTDNGHWILIGGAALMLLALAGFVYLIVSGVVRRKAIRANAAAKPSVQHYAAPKNQYNDGYSADRSKKSKGGKRYK